jgi:hypothetical protein
VIKMASSLVRVLSRGGSLNLMRPKLDTVIRPLSAFPSARRSKTTSHNQVSSRHGRMARGCHGLPKVLLGPAMPYSSTLCGRTAAVFYPTPYASGWLSSLDISLIYYRVCLELHDLGCFSLRIPRSFFPRINM